MKIVTISDTHSFHRQIQLPEADVLIHAGDISWEGEPKILMDFMKWLCEQEQINHKIFIAGNHETSLEVNPDSANILFKTSKAKAANVHYLQDSTIEIDGIKFYGSPYQPWFYDWGFNFPERDASQGYPFAKNHWAKIPDDTNVLITHGPARGYSL